MTSPLFYRGALRLTPPPNPPMGSLALAEPGASLTTQEGIVNG